MRRIIMMMFRNFLLVPYMLVRLMNYAVNDKISEEKRYSLIRYIARRGNKSGNVIIDVYGQENQPSESGYIMFPNHQGMYDVMGIVDTHEKPFSVVIKKEAENIFLLKKVIQTFRGQFMDRDDLKQSMRVIKQVTKEVQEGRNYLIFPEGTRSKQGNQMLPFKSGSFKSATKAKCPIVPIAIIDSFKPFDIKSLKKVKVQIHYLPPIYYDEYKDMNTAEIAKEVQARIRKTIEKYES